MKPSLSKILPSVSVYLAAIALGSSVPVLAESDAPTSGFPFILPKEKPDRPMSAAMARIYDNYSAPRPEDNELFSQFKYTEIKGFDYNDNNGTITRRDPSKVIFENGRYYVWYTYRNTPTPPQGADLSTDIIPSRDWDLAEIWYATSEDGFTWEEQGVAVPRPPKPQVGWRSVTTTDILKWEGKYYLYYQGFMEASGKRGDDCPVAVSYANSPDGPWTAHGEIVIPNGAPGEWDQYSIHDPYPLVHDGKIYIYYKSDFASPQSGDHVRTRDHAVSVQVRDRRPRLQRWQRAQHGPIRRGLGEFCHRLDHRAHARRRRAVCPGRFHQYRRRSRYYLGPRPRDQRGQQLAAKPRDAPAL